MINAWYPWLFTHFVLEGDRRTVKHELSTPWVDLRRRAILRLLQTYYESGVSQIGSNLSCLDLMLVLHHDILGKADQFVLSKRHPAELTTSHSGRWRSSPVKRSGTWK